ncbi:MAG: response regulator transcription factor [Anaerolineae bacterium]|nr:response regulator transcription factor [Anaerolineae bacterium]
MAEPEGYIRIFIDEGQPIAALLGQAAARGIMVNYVEALLSAFAAEAQGGIAGPTGERELPPASPPFSSFALIEPLSERELEVLRLIAAGLSNREIAAELVVAVSTVKTHVNNIYRKLDVSSRTQAVAVARALKLL